MDHDPAARHMDPATINMSSKELETRRDAAKDLVVKIAALDSEKLKVKHHMIKVTEKYVFFRYFVLKIIDFSCFF